MAQTELKKVAKESEQPGLAKDGAAEKKTVTRATKARRQKDILRKLLKVKKYKWNDLLEEAVKTYLEKYGEEETDIPDLKGKFGSNFSLLEEDGEVGFEKETNTCFLIAKEKAEEKTDEKNATKKTPVKRKTAKAARTEQGENGETAIDKKEAGKIASTSDAAKEEKENKKREAIRKSLQQAVEKAAAGKIAVKESKKSVDAKEETGTIGEEKPQEAKRRGRKPAQEKSDKIAAEMQAGTANAVEKSAAQDSVSVASHASESEGKKPEESVEKNASEAKKEAKKREFVSFGFIGRAEKEQEKENASEQGEKGDFATTSRASASQDTKKKERDFLSDFVFLGNAGKSNGTTSSEKLSEDSKQTEKSGVEEHVEKKAEAREKTQEKPQVKLQEKPQETETVAEKSATEKKQGRKNAETAAQNAEKREAKVARSQTRTEAGATRGTRTKNTVQTPTAFDAKAGENKLKEEFLRRLRLLSGEYFEYYSVYLLERYSLKNGRRLEGLRVSGGKNDGGIDGEIELTDRFGFRETIYIQAKNWDPTKGAAEKWMIGETLVQQFVGAATCRQLKDGKRNCRGIFMTTSSFTKEAKEVLSVLGEKFVGYDGDDIFEAAKECSFGVIFENGAWKLDEKLLESDKAFFRL